MEDNEIPELSELELARWDATKAAIAGLGGALVEGTLDEESLAATQAQLAQLDLDMARVRDSLHIPEDAGEHADQLRAILLRIPDGWGRWISCDAGWHPLIVELHTQIVAIAPDYELHQVKEKFGGLRYYIDSRCTEAALDEAVHDLITVAEDRSYTICECCSGPGTPSRNAGWYKTVCPACAERLGFTPLSPT